MEPDAATRKESDSLALVAQYSGALAVVFSVATACRAILPQTGYLFSALMFLMAIVLAGTRWHRGPVILMAILSALTWNFVFLQPQFTFLIHNPGDLAVFALFFIVALSMGHLTSNLRQREDALERHHRERESLLAERHRANLLAESERLHRTLLDSVSHELKTPITIIRTALDGLASPNPYTAEITTATRRLQHIVDNFLGMTRVEADALRPNLNWEELHDVIRAATSPLEEEFRSRPLLISGLDSLPLLKLDSRLLAQALSNILHNAASYSPQGSSVEISASFLANSLEISVRDHGKGIPDGAENAVFDKFYRGPDVHAGGTGLGLAIARGLVRSMRGDISARNHPDGGACFTIRLPAQAAPLSP
ncbi:MAG: two-component system, OmpR family, sensor histidine kinase KdpD [Verrucomicrobia bacterium]|nr:MAG: two-component system, OmpR family, sensor histidine kinase KdpD [Verrucomicrobiota bacterium]